MQLLKIFTPIKPSYFMIVTCPLQSTIIRVSLSPCKKCQTWSLFGELICVINMEHPLPYRWRHKVENQHRRLTKLLNAKRVLAEIKKKYSEF